MSLGKPTINGTQVTKIDYQSNNVAQNKAQPQAQETKPSRIGSKLKQITATSIAVPMVPYEKPTVIEKAAPLEILIDKTGLDNSSLKNSDESQPLRESELLNNKKSNPPKSGDQDLDLEFNSQDVMVQHSDHFMMLQKQLEDPQIAKIASQYIGMDEIPEEVIDHVIASKPKDFHSNYYNEDEPMPSMRVPEPHSLTANYKQARDQKKWSKVNEGIGLL